MFPNLSNAKVKGGIFAGPEIASVVKYKTTENRVSSKKRNRGNLFVM